MTGVVGRNITGTLEYFRIGTVWPGTVLRGVWMVTTNNAATGNLQFALALSGEKEASLEALNAGVSLVDDSELRLGSIIHPCLLVFTAIGQPAEFTMPVYRTVAAGPLHVLCGATGAGSSYLMAGLVVEPERVVRPAIERGPAGRRLRDNGRILEVLREEARAAQMV